jgi:hypothetical protein
MNYALLTYWIVANLILWAYALGSQSNRHFLGYDFGFMFIIVPLFAWALVPAGAVGWFMLWWRMR